VGVGVGVGFGVVCLVVHGKCAGMNVVRARARARAWSMICINEMTNANECFLRRGV
jgi:hypothetical protein